MRFHAPRRRASALVLGLLLAAACETAVSPDSSILSISISPKPDTLDVGQTLQLSAAVQMMNPQSTPPSATWSSSNNAALTVSGTGMATALAAGTALVRATAAGRSDST